MGSTDFELERSVEVWSHLHGGKGIVAEGRSPELASGLDFCSRGREIQMIRQRGQRKRRGRKMQ